jgi:hypothetical protein
MNFMPPPLRCLSIVGLSLALAACDTPPTLVDQHFGMAVQLVQSQQSQQKAPVADTDGAAALSGVTRYQQSFQTPPAPTPTFSIGLGVTSTP